MRRFRLPFVTFMGWGIDIALQTNKEWESDKVRGWITIHFKPLYVYYSPDATPCHPKAKMFVGREA